PAAVGYLLAWGKAERVARLLTPAEARTIAERICVAFGLSGLLDVLRRAMHAPAGDEGRPGRESGREALEQGERGERASGSPGPGIGYEDLKSHNGASGGSLSGGPEEAGSSGVKGGDSDENELTGARIGTSRGIDQHRSPVDASSRRR